jgi:hypothetical protein
MLFNNTSLVKAEISCKRDLEDDWIVTPPRAMRCVTVQNQTVIFYLAKVNKGLNRFEKVGASFNP